MYIKQRQLWYYRVKYVHIIRLCEGQFPENMVLKGVQYLHISSLNISTKGMDSECQQCKRHVFLPSLFFLSNPSKKRIARGVKWVYDHLGRIWMSFRCRSDVVSDVVQIASGFQKFTIILLCDRSRPSDKRPYKQQAWCSNLTRKSAVPSQLQKITLKKTLDPCTIGMWF